VNNGSGVDASIATGPSAPPPPVSSPQAGAEGAGRRPDDWCRSACSGGSRASYRTIGASRRSRGPCLSSGSSEWPRRRNERRPRSSSGPGPRSMSGTPVGRHSTIGADSPGRGPKRPSLKVVPLTHEPDEPPAELGARGRVLWAAFTADTVLEDSAEREMLRQICLVEDRVEQLAAMAETDARFLRDELAARGFIARTLNRLRTRHRTTLGRPPRG